jgi:hypothetical protein
VLKENIKTKLRVFEKSVLRRIYGPTKKSAGTWRIKTNEELNKLIRNKKRRGRRFKEAWFETVENEGIG